MPSKTQESRMDQKLFWQDKLTRRLSVLAEKGHDPAKIAKDPDVKKFRGQLRKTESRLKAIAEREKKKKEMAKTKAEKQSAPQKEKSKKKKEKGAEESKRQKKKKEKKAKKEIPTEE